MLKTVYYYSLPVLKVLLFVIFFFIGLIPFGLISDFNLINEQAISPLMMEIISEVVTVLSILVALLMSFKAFKQYNFKSVFVTNTKILGSFAKGTLFGFTLLSLLGLITLLTGNVAFSLGKISPILVFGYFILYVLVAIFEEFLFRSFPLLVFAERYPAMLSVIITGLLFGVAHFGNPGFTAMAMLNITLAGILFALIILITKNIYWAVGIHFGWNFTQGVLLGYKVSGTDNVGVLNATPKGSVYLSGGNFGIESSIICTLLLLISIIYLLMKYKIEEIPELVRQEEGEQTI